MVHFSCDSELEKRESGYGRAGYQDFCDLKKASALADWESAVSGLELVGGCRREVDMVGRLGCV